MLDRPPYQRLFRTAVSTDAPRLHEIRVAAFEPVFGSFRAALGAELADRVMPQILAGQAAQLDTYLAGGEHVWVNVVEDGGEAVAFCTVAVDPASKVGEIGLNAVDPAQQRRGIGLWMYRQALDQLRAAGMEIASVGTGDDPGHAPARRVYSRAGFTAAIPAMHLYRSL